MSPYPSGMPFGMGSQKMSLLSLIATIASGLGA